MWETIKNGAKAAMDALAEVPMSSILKVGVLVGVTIFTAWVMIRRTKKNLREANREKARNRAPVDDILEHGYATDADAYDDMDPLAQEICRELNRGWRPRKKRKRNKRKQSRPREKDIFQREREQRQERRQNARVVSVFDDDDASDLDAILFRGADELFQMTRERSGKQGRHKKYRRPKVRDDDEDIFSTPKRRRRFPRINSETMDEIHNLTQEWRVAGLTDQDTIRHRLQQIADDLGIALSQLDAAVEENLREENPALF